MIDKEKFPVIDGLDVIEQYMLFKGEHVAFEHENKMRVAFKPLIEMAIVHYGLKLNATNKLKVRFDLEKFFMRRGMMFQEVVEFPKQLYVRVAEINNEFRSHNKTEE